MSSFFRWTIFMLLGAIGLTSGVIGISEVFQCANDSRAADVLVVPMRADRRGTAQIFYDIGRGINEQDSATVEIWPTMDLRDIRFTIPRETIFGLRFDPISSEGYMLIGRPRLETPRGRTIMSFPLSAVQPVQQIAEHSIDNSVLRLRTVPDANDPILQLALPHALEVASEPRQWPWLAGLAGLTLGASLFFLREWRQIRGHLKKSFVILLDPRDRAGFWLGAVVVGTVQFWILWPLHRVLDFPMWDEAGYMAWSGRWFEAGSPARFLFNCPLYVLQYAAELKLLGDTGTAFFFHNYFFKTVTTVLLYAVLFRTSRNWLLALGIALLWANSAFQAEQSLLVYHAALFWLLTAILAADLSALLAMLCLLTAACVRQEYQFAALTFGGWQVWRIISGKTKWAEVLVRRAEYRGLISFSCISLLALLLYVFLHISVAGSSVRAWFAFQQHYAVRAVIDGRAAGIDPWLDYPQLIARDFPKAHSLAEAVSDRPSLVGKHILGNFAQTPAAFLDLVHPAKERITAAVLIAFGVALLSWLSRPKTGDRPAHAVGGVAVAIAAFPALAPGLAIFAKDAYLLASLPAAAMVACYAVSSLAMRLPTSRHGGLMLSCVGATLIVMITASATSHRRFDIAPQVRPMAERIAALDLHWPADRRLRLLGVPAITYQTHLGAARCKGVEGLATVLGITGSQPTLREQLEREQPDVVLITPEWSRSASFDSAAAKRLLQTPRWRTLPLTDGTAFFSN